MATRNSRDVTMTLAIEALGEDNVARLQAAVLDLAKQGGNAAPEFQRLADEIDRVGRQGEALKAFRDLSEETQRLQARQTEAAASADRLARETEQLWSVVQKARAEQREATRALNDGRLANIEAGNAIRLLKVEYDAAGKQTQEYRDRLRELTDVQGRSRANLVQLSQASRDAANATSEAEKAYGKVQREFANAAKSSDELQASLRRQEGALAESAQAAQALGVATDDIAAAEAELLQSVNRAGEAARRRAESIREMTEADRLLAIEERTLADLQERAQVALRQEEASQRDAAKAARDYAAAKAKAMEDAAQWQREADAIVDAAEAARTMARQTEVLVEVQRELKAQNAFDEQAAAARRMGESADYIRFWTTALEQADRQAAETAAEAKKLGDAFDSIGIRSAQELTAEIQRIRTAMQTLADSGQLTGQQLKVAFAAGDAQIRQLELELRKLNGTMTMADRAAGLLKNSMGQIAAGNLVADAIASIVERVKEMGREFISVIVNTEKLRRSLNAIYKDGGLAARQFDVLKAVASEAGVSVNQLQDSFVRFAASAQSAGVSVKVTNDLFRNLTLAGASLGLSSDQVSGALDALAQMASKGVVTMEELRQQLGDRLPGAIGLAAKGLGITEQQLVKLVETGQLTTDQFFPAFSSALKTMQGDTNTLAAAWARFTNLLTAGAQAAGDSGWLPALSGGLRVLGTVLGAVVLTLNSFAEGLFIAGKAALAFYETLKGNGKEAWGFFNEELRKSNERLNEQSRNLINYAKGVNATATTVESASVVLGGNTSALLSNAAAQERAGAAAQGTGNAYVQTLAKMAENTAAVEANIVASEKLLKAKEQEGQSLVAAAKLSGDVARELQASAEAAQANVAAAEQVVAAREKEVATTRQAIAVIEAEGTRRGGLTSAMKAQIEALQNKLKKQDADLEQSKQAIKSYEAQARATEVLNKAYADNSTQIDALRAKKEALQAVADSTGAALRREEQSLAVLKDMLDRGVISQDLYNRKLAEVAALQQRHAAAVQDAAAAEALYRDSVADTIKNLELENKERLVGLQTQQASAAATAQLAEQKAKMARASGDVAQAAYYENEAMRAQIEVQRIKIQIDEAQANLQLEILRIKLRELDTGDALYEQKKREIELNIQLQEVTLKQVAASKELISLKETERLQNLNRNEQLRGESSARGGVTSATNAQSDALAKLMMQYTMSANYTEQQIKLLEAEAAAAERAAEAYRKKWNIDKDGFTLGSNGQRMTQAVPYERYAYDTAKSQGLSEAEALRIMDKFWQNGRSTGWGNQTPGTGPVKDWFSLVNDEINKAVIEGARQRAAGGGSANQSVAGGSTPPPSASGSSTVPTGRSSSGGVSSGATRTVNININGTTFPVGVASDADGNRLVSTLRALETQANTAIRS